MINRETLNYFLEILESEAVKMNEESWDDNEIAFSDVLLNLIAQVRVAMAVDAVGDNNNG